MKRRHSPVLIFHRWKRGEVAARNREYTMMLLEQKKSKHGRGRKPELVSRTTQKLPQAQHKGSVVRWLGTQCRPLLARSFQPRRSQSQAKHQGGAFRSGIPAADPGLWENPLSACGFWVSPGCLAEGVWASQPRWDLLWAPENYCCSVETRGGEQR